MLLLLLRNEDVKTHADGALGTKGKYHPFFYEAKIYKKFVKIYKLQESLIGILSKN